MSTDTCCRIHVARSGYMLTVSRQHNYYGIHLCHGRLVFVSLCIQQQTGNKFCCRHNKHVDGDRTHVADNMCPAALVCNIVNSMKPFRGVVSVDG